MNVGKLNYTPMATRNLISIPHFYEKVNISEWYTFLKTNVSICAKRWYTKWFLVYACFTIHLITFLKIFETYMYLNELESTAKTSNIIKLQI